MLRLPWRWLNTEPFGSPQHTGSHPQAQHKGQGFPFSLWVIPQTLHHKGKCLWKQGISKLLLSKSASMPSQMKVASKSDQEIPCTWCIFLSLPGRRCLSQAFLGVGGAQRALKHPPSHGDKELTPQLSSPPPQLSNRRWRDGSWKSLTKISEIRTDTGRRLWSSCANSEESWKIKVALETGKSTRLILEKQHSYDCKPWEGKHHLQKHNSGSVAHREKRSISSWH